MLIAVGMAAAGCVDAGAAALPEVKSGAVGAVAWGEDSYVYFVRERVDLPAELYRFRPKSGQPPRAVKFDAPTGCQSAGIAALRPVPGNRLAMNVRCSVSSPVRGYVVILDPSTGGVSPMATLETFPGPGLAYGSNRRTIVTTYQELKCQSIVAFRDEAPLAFSAPADAAGSKLWPDQYRRDRKFSCGSDGDASWPMLDSDYLLYYVIRTRPTSGFEPDIVGSASALVRQDDPTIGSANVVAADFRDTTVVAYPVNGGKFAVLSTYRVVGGDGTWLLSLVTGTWIRASATRYGAMAFAPDGKTLIAFDPASRRFTTIDVTKVS